VTLVQELCTHSHLDPVGLLWLASCRVATDCRDGLAVEAIQQALAEKFILHKMPLTKDAITFWASGYDSAVAAGKARLNGPTLLPWLLHRLGAVN
jgi:hypothetical protein